MFLKPFHELVIVYPTEGHLKPNKELINQCQLIPLWKNTTIIFGSLEVEGEIGSILAGHKNLGNQVQLENQSMDCKHHGIEP